MKTKKNLILITGYFPYFTQETFLESEIIELANEFDNITILPTKVDNRIRPVPPNVKVDTTYATLFETNSAKYKSIFSLFFLNGMLQHLKYLYSLMAIRRINSFIADAQNTHTWLKKNCPYDAAIIYTYWLNGKTHGAGMFAKNKADYKVVSRAHRYDLYEYWYTPSFWPFRTQTLNLIDKVYLIADDGLNYLKEKYSGFKNKFELSKLGVYNPKNITKKSDDNCLRLVSVSGLIPMKRIDLLAASLCNYTKKHPADKIIWTHMGDGVMKASILEYLKINAPANLNYTFKGHVKNTDVFKFYKDNVVDIFINVSESEGLPVSIMEAQSNGIFTVATDVGGVSEIVNKNTGYLLPKSFSDQQFEEAIATSKNDTNLSAENIFSFWNSNYNADTNYRSFAKKLNSLLNTK